MSLKHKWTNRCLGLEEGAWKPNNLSLVSLSIFFSFLSSLLIHLALTLRHLIPLCAVWTNWGLQAIRLLSFNSVLPVNQLVFLPTGSDLMTMDYDCICSALGTYEFSYYLSSDDVAHIITQLNHFWLYIQPWHKLYPAAAVLVVGYKAWKWILLLWARNSLKQFMLWKLRSFS